MLVGRGWGQTKDKPAGSRPSLHNIRVRNNLPHMPVLALEVKPAPLVQVVDRPVRPRARPAPEGDPLVLDPLQDYVKLLVRGQEGVVIGTRVSESSKSSVRISLILTGAKCPQGPSYFSPNIRAMNSPTSPCRRRAR